jgi:hypothetical protein
MLPGSRASKPPLAPENVFWYSGAPVVVRALRTTCLTSLLKIAPFGVYPFASTERHRRRQRRRERVLVRLDVLRRLRRRAQRAVERRRDLRPGRVAEHVRVDQVVERADDVGVDQDRRILASVVEEFLREHDDRRDLLHVHRDLAVLSARRGLRCRLVHERGGRPARVHRVRGRRCRTAETQQRHQGLGSSWRPP